VLSKIQETRYQWCFPRDEMWRVYSLIEEYRHKTRDSLDIEKYSFLFALHFLLDSNDLSENRICLLYNWKRVDLTTQFNSLRSFLKAVRKYLLIFNERLIKRDQPLATVISNGACIYCLPIYACQSSKRSFAKEKFKQQVEFRRCSRRKQSLRQ